MTENHIIIHAYKSPWYVPFGWIVRTKNNSKINHVSVEIPESLGLDCTGIYETKMFKGAIISKRHLIAPKYSHFMVTPQKTDSAAYNP